MMETSSDGFSLLARGLAGAAPPVSAKGTSRLRFPDWTRETAPALSRSGCSQLLNFPIQIYSRSRAARRTVGPPATAPTRLSFRRASNGHAGGRSFPGRETLASLPHSPGSIVRTSVRWA
jgi:hypothetical protein